MPANLSSTEKKLIRRYLLWCYKTTKESLDRIDRKFTQVKVDRQILKYLHDHGTVMGKDENYAHQLVEFEKYIAAKDQDGVGQKFANPKSGVLKGEYIYLQQRLSGIEKAVVYFLGTRDLSAIKSSYEKEMTRRILESREH